MNELGDSPDLISEEPILANNPFDPPGKTRTMLEQKLLKKLRDHPEQLLLRKVQINLHLPTNILGQYRVTMFSLSTEKEMLGNLRKQ